jgi:LacI family transcriptional regulator
LPRGANNHFQTARSAVDAALRHGCVRPGLVLVDQLDRQLDRRFSAGFRAGLHDIAPAPAPGTHAAPLLMQQLDRAVFAKWVKTERPDVIITDQVAVLEWLRDFKISVPAEIGLIHLDWMPHLRDWAGMNQNSRLIGVAAADLVIGQMTRNEVGPPDHPSLVLIESDFVAGPSLKAAPVPRAPASAPVVRAGAIVAR